MEKNGIHQLERIVLAIRGVVMGGVCQTDFKGESEGLLQEAFGCPVTFMNDVEGMARGIKSAKCL